MLPSLPGVHLLSWEFPLSLIPGIPLVFFLCGSPVSCTLCSFFVPSILKFHWDISWCGFIFSIVLSTTWTFLIWKLMSFRLRNFLELFLLVWPLHVIWSFIICLLELLLLDVETPGVVLLSSPVCRIFFLLLYFLWYILNFIHQFFFEYLISAIMFCI